MKEDVKESVVAGLKKAEEYGAFGFICGSIGAIGAAIFNDVAAVSAIAQCAEAIVPEVKKASLNIVTSSTLISGLAGFGVGWCGHFSRDM